MGRRSGASLVVVALALAGSALAATSKPSITKFAPASGKAGTKLTITGKSFSRTTAVRIGGAKANYVVSSATKITATVPIDAVTGKISVIAKNGTATSAKVFTVSIPGVAGYAPNGSGTMTASVTSVPAGSSGNTIVFTYTAAAGGMRNGSVTITVPQGWTPPVTTATAGCVSGPGLAIATDGQTITVYYLTLAAGASAAITYGATSGSSYTGAACAPGNGATAPATAGPYTFTTKQKSTGEATAGGLATDLAVSPTVRVA
jgi:hypothetical protein